MAQITATFTATSDGSTVTAVTLRSTWKWSESSAGNYQISQAPRGTSKVIDFDLTTIPANAEIISATLSFSASRSSYNYGGFPSQPSITHNYTIGGKNGSGAGNRSFEITITPNAINSINFYYKPSLSKNSYQSDSSIADTSCSTTYSFKNITLTVVYKDNNVYYGNSTWKNCEVFYGINGEWKPCTVYFGKDGTWKQV